MKPWPNPIHLPRRIGFLTLVIASWSCVCAFADWTPEPVHFDPTPIHYVWQGPDQTVYAGGGRTENHLLRWNETGWETLAPLPGRIYFGFTSSDGTVWFLTRIDHYRQPGNIQGLWRWEPGADSPEPTEGFDPASFSIVTSFVHFHAVEDRNGRIILTTQSPKIYVIEDGRFHEWHSVEKPDPPTDSQGRRPEWGYLFPWQLADGRIAVIGYGPSNNNIFSEILVIDDLQINVYPMPEYKNPRFMNSRVTFMKHDPRGAIYEATGGYILLLDMGTFEFTRLDVLPSPQSAGFFLFWQQDGETVWALFFRQLNENLKPQKGQIRLWRQKHGEWKPFSDWIDYDNAIGDFSHWSIGGRTDDPFISGEDALWIGTSTTGLIRIDRESGDFRYLNWRNGLPLLDASRVYPLSDDRIWAGSKNGAKGSGSFKTAEIHAQAKPDERIMSFHALTASIRWPSLQTSDKNIYELRMLRAGDRDGIALQKWNGQSWDSVLLPTFTGHPLQHLLLRDFHDRIWVVQSHWNEGSRKAVIMDGGAMEPLAEGEFHDLLVAYSKEQQAPGFHPGFDIANNHFLPYISNQGHILYHDRRNLIAFNGKTWGPVLQSDISPDYQASPLLSFGRIEDTGHPAVRINLKTYSFTEDGRWLETEAPFISVSGQHGLRELQSRDHDYKKVVEAFGLSQKTRVWDLGEGIHWIQTADGQAYLTYGSWKVGLIPDGGATPLPLIDDFIAYYIDGLGQHLLRVGQGWLVFPALEPGVSPEVTASRLSPDSMLIEVSKDDSVTAWRWRVNQGAWSEAARHTRLEISSLLPAPHQVDIQPLSPSLSWMDVQTVEFEINYDLELMLAETLPGLMSDNWEQRRLAIRRLAIDPPKALALLGAVDIYALSDEDRWWLETARQTMQRTQPVINQMQPYTQAP